MTITSTSQKQLLPTLYNVNEIKRVDHRVAQWQLCVHLLWYINQQLYIYHTNGLLSAVLC